MPAIVILGLKLPFRELWEKIGVQERPLCRCPDNTDAFTYCPHCGVRKATKKIKVYKSRLTGEETTYRNVDAVMEFLYNNKLEIYDTNPRGYTDDPVYIYFTQPNCYLEVSRADPVSMAAIQKYPYELEDWLRNILGEELWNAGSFGLWAFVTNSNDPAEHSDTPSPPLPPAEKSSGETRTFIIPIGPRFNSD